MLQIGRSYWVFDWAPDWSWEWTDEDGNHHRDYFNISILKRRIEPDILVPVFAVFIGPICVLVGWLPEKLASS